MVKIKICGITNLTDAEAAADCGADALGFIFYKGSKRYVEPRRAGEIIACLPPFITTVGVFVNQSTEEIKAIRDLSGFDMAQLHGDESPGFCESLPMGVIKVVRLRDRGDLGTLESYNVSAFLFDTYSEDSYGGTAETFDWDLINDLGSKRPVILSGGLNSDNVAEAIGRVKPYGVDVSSGVEESPGKKDADKIKRFIEEARNESRDAAPRL